MDAFSESSKLRTELVWDMKGLSENDFHKK